MSEVALESFLAVAVAAVACYTTFVIKDAFEDGFVKLSDDTPLCPTNHPEF